MLQSSLGGPISRALEIKISEVERQGGADKTAVSVEDRAVHPHPDLGADSGYHTGTWQEPLGRGWVGVGREASGP